MRHLLIQLLYEMEEHRDTVLVSIVSESGSTPRGTGSQMLVSSRGRVNGTIGGGRVEKQSEKTALSLLTERRSVGPVPADGAPLPLATLRAEPFRRAGQPGHGLRRGCHGAVSVHPLG